MRFFLVIVCLASAFSGEAFGQVSARFVAEGIANCQQPALANFPIRIEGTGTLSTDGRGRLDVNNSALGAESIDVKLGPKKTETPGGSASLRVTGRRSLRAIREYPNNYVYIDLRVVGRGCVITVRHALKPGRKQYTFVGSNGIVALCARPPIFSRTSCTPI
jgi:hypothetical protein